VPNILQSDGGSIFPEGVLDFLGKIAWGCQISRGTNFPVTPGHLRQRVPKRRRRSHEERSFFLTIASRMMVSFFPECSLEALGRCLRNFTDDTEGREKLVAG